VIGVTIAILRTTSYDENLPVARLSLRASRCLRRERWLMYRICRACSVPATRRGLHRIIGSGSAPSDNWKVALPVRAAGRLAGRKEDLTMIGNVRKDAALVGVEQRHHGLVMERAEFRGWYCQDPRTS
jgi:hypothetical protein